jgi:O-antigen/teichoic acid export membrane protein
MAEILAAPASDDSQRRTRARHERQRPARRTTLTSFGGRGVGMLLSLVSAPLTLHVLDAERYGLWITIGSMLGWLSIADLGLGNGLTNQIAAAQARGDREAARVAVSTSFAIIGVVTALMAALFALAFPFVPWRAVFAVTPRVGDAELSITIALCAGIFFAQFPLGLVEKIYSGFQEGYVSNAWAVAANVLTVLALVAVVRLEGGLPALVVALSGVPLLVRLANTRTDRTSRIVALFVA